MREIKFRAWDSKNKKMYSFELIELPYSENVNLDGQFDGLLDMYYKLMQYTGLLDKNGVEIYEGDELSIEIYDGVYSIYTVEWNNEKASFILIEKSSDNEESFDDWLGTETFEVVGNIYENSNLLGDNIEQN